jgi:hypothetical protein
MAAANHKPFSAPAASWEELTTSLNMPSAFAEYFSQQPPSVAPSLVQGTSAASLAPSAPHQPVVGHTETAVAALSSDKSKVSKRKPAVVNGIAPGAADDDVFAPPPIVITTEKRARAPTMCGNCGEQGHTKRKCQQPKRERQLRALAVRELLPAQRQHREQERIGVDPLQNSDASSECSGVVDGAVHEDVADEALDSSCKYKGCQWTLHNIAAAPPAARPVSFGTRSPPPPERPQNLEFVGVPPFLLHQSKSHAKNIPRGCQSELDFVKLLLHDGTCDDFILNAVYFTNQVAHDSARLQGTTRHRNWRDVDAQEMLTYFAICCYLGVVKIQNRKHTWQKKGLFHQPWITARMSLKRFERITNALNVSNAAVLSDADLQAANARDPYWQIAAVVESCNTKCANFWHMGRLMSLDEAVIPFKGHHRARCYNKAKPAKYHLKKFSLTCAKSGYNYAHYFYQGKTEQRPAHITATTFPVVKLLDMCPELHNHNRVLAIDNWFTSCMALTSCITRGVHCVGTMRPSRLGLEDKKDGTFPLAGVFRGGGKAQRGDSICYSTITDAGHKHYATCWQDAEPITVMSTWPPYMGTCVRKIREERGWTEQVFRRPTVFQDYNSAMGGTDLHDMRLAFIRSTVKSRRWIV